MTYLWLCISAWLALNALVIAQVVIDIRDDRRAAKPREVFNTRGGAR